MTGADLRERRENLGYSQEGLAEALGTQQQSISRWETGERPITRHRAVWLDVELTRMEAAEKRRRAGLGKVGVRV